ncbi:HD domain-containing protein [Nonomuraea sp. GTA35]|uniref:HD domain-containing protein n=1 Tax=Nonomuraea sp. GTA35 TaxID=1676746 RepID=UPI0035BFB58F
MHHSDSILAILGADTWHTAHRDRALAAADLALAVYEGKVRDQGTPYIEHPLAVVTILRDELLVTQPETLLLGLLHDALELSPGSEPEIAAHLGRLFAEELRAMTPDHRLENRPKRAMDEGDWRIKIQNLSLEGLLVRFADRIHNLRDLGRSPDNERRQRFIASLVDFYLPLTRAAQVESPSLKRAYELLEVELHRYRTSAS